MVSSGPSRICILELHTPSYHRGRGYVWGIRLVVRELGQLSNAELLAAETDGQVDSLYHFNCSGVQHGAGTAQLSLGCLIGLGGTFQHRTTYDHI